MSDHRREEPVSTHGECPACGANGSFSEWADGSGFCHSCNEKIRGKPKPMKPVARGEYREVRGIPADVCQMYGIQVQVAEDGDPVRYAFKYPNNTKYRGYEDKKFWLKDKGELVDLFGPEFNAGSSKRIYITEGEFDAASLFFALGKSYPVKSIPSAGIGDRFMQANLDYLKSFQEIVLCLDNDAAGIKAAERIYAVFPDRTFHVPMTKHKDANAFLQAGDVNDLKWAALKPQRWTPENFFVSEADFEDIFEEPPYTYVPTGHHKLDSLINGITRGCITLITAQEGVGKSELAGFFEYQTLAQDDSVKIAVCHLEETKAVVAGRLASYLAEDKLKYAAGDAVLKVKAKEALRPWLEGGRLVLLDMLESDDAYAIVDHMRLSKTVYGCDFVFLDHIHQIAEIGAGEDDERRILDRLSNRFARLCRDLDMGLVIVSHVNDDGKTRSSRMIRKQAGVVIDLERDITAEDEMLRNITSMTVSKNRPWGNTGPAGMLRYEPTTGLITEFQP